MHNLEKRRIRPFGPLVAALALVGFAGAAQAGTGRLLSRWMSRAPAIDGQLGAGEWSAATFVDLGNGVTLRIGNDDRTLYLGLLDSGDTELGPGDWFILSFDDEGGPTPILDDGHWILERVPRRRRSSARAYRFYRQRRSELPRGSHKTEFCANQPLTDRLSAGVGVLPQG